MALITTSGSMPFSLASASIVCCSGFDILYPLELHLEIRARDRTERHAVRLPVLAVDQHVAALDATEPPPEESLAVDPLAHHDLRDAPGEAAVVVRAAQRAIQPRRRNLERIGGRHDVLDVENRAHLAADVRAVLDAHALLRRRRRPGPVDLHPEHHARRFAPELDVEDLEAAIGGNAAGDLTHLLDDRFGGHKRKKWAHAHSVLHPGSETKLIASDAAKVHRRKQRLQTRRARPRPA